MPSPNPGLKVQAAHAIADISEKDRVLQVLIAKCDDNDKVEVDIMVLMSLRNRINSDAVILQKMDQKIDQLNEDLFKL